MIVAMIATALTLGSANKAYAAVTMGPTAVERHATIPFQSGQQVFEGICQGCHMPNARGAVGAGTYPSLVNDLKLQVPGYPLAIVVHGQKAMPGFAKWLSDQQIANVVNYIREHFGNHFHDHVSPEDVGKQR